MREPTREEMIEGIAQGFERVFKYAHPYGHIGSEKIREAIAEGVEKAFASKVQVEDLGAYFVAEARVMGRGMGEVMVAEEGFVERLVMGLGEILAKKRQKETQDV